VAVLSPADAARVLEKATSSSAALRRRVETNAEARRFAEALAGETRRVFARAMNAVAFSMSEKTNVVNDDDDDVNEGVTGGTTQEERRTWRPSDLRSSRGYDFAASRERFAFVATLTKPEAVRCFAALTDVNLELMRSWRAFCMSTEEVKVSETSRLSAPFSVEEFCETQRVAADALATHLKTDWFDANRDAVVTSFETCGKGWFNLRETDRTAYDFSKMRRVLLGARLRMEDTLRSLAETSVREFGAFMETRLVSTLDDVVASKSTNANPKSTNSNPLLFRLEMAIDPGGAPVVDKLGRASVVPPSFRYAADLDAFRAAILEAYDRGAAATSGVKTTEPGVMTGLPWTFWPSCASVSANDPLVAETRARLDHALRRATDALTRYLTTYDEYVPLLELDVAATIGALRGGGGGGDGDDEGRLGRYLEAVAFHEARAAHIAENVPLEIAVGCFRVDVSKVRKTLLEKREALAEKSRGLIAEVPKKICDGINRRFADLLAKLEQPRDTPEAIQVMRDLGETVPRFCVDQMFAFDECAPFYDALAAQRRALSDEDNATRATAQFWPTRLRRARAAQEAEALAEAHKFEEDQNEAQEIFETTTRELAERVDEMSALSNMSKTADIAKTVERLHTDLKNAQGHAVTFNSREGVFGKKATDYSNIRATRDAFDPFYKFWTYARDWQTNKNRWWTEPFAELDAETMEATVSDAFKVMFKMGKAFTTRKLPQNAANCEAIRKELDEFQKFVPLCLALRSPGMRDRHWEKISADTGLTVPRAGDVAAENEEGDMEVFSLEKLVESGAFEEARAEAMFKVSEIAGKEYAIETAIEKMVAEWEGVDLEVREYRETETYVVRVDETVTQMLDDHIVMAQAMSFSPFKKPFEARIHEWERTLSMTSEVLDEWLALQRAWMYLEPIFGSDDIMEQLPLEGKRFGAVDRSWRKTLLRAKATPGVLKMCDDRQLLETFRDANRVLDGVQKGLAEYLETKRLAFARFFFLSNDELLQILSQTKNPLAVQPHLRKCFEAIQTLDFEDDLSIVAMNSAEGEKVPFAEKMKPKGAVEMWLGEVERIMKKSCRHSVVESLADYNTKPRPEWVTQWPAMTVLGVTATYWTSLTEKAISEGALQAWFDQNVSQLDALTDMVRGRLPGQHRKTLGALITIDVHARDVVGLLQRQDVKALTDFDWVAQLRYYWEQKSSQLKPAGDDDDDDDDDEEEDAEEGAGGYGGGAGTSEGGDLWCKMVQASLPFGYEYLGNQPRLVVTPLTDRCYMTLMGAMHLNLGGAPAGPAGTGKTETTKDLAKGLAMQCVVFNCSDGLDYLAMAKFFKGLASSGAWACFDEFNRIDLEVLSVIAAQILTIQNAIQRGLRRFVFEDSEISLDPRCAVFITMNPGYAGRSELPDNLKALFRPCAMMVPDYALIGEISLMSFGFKRGRPLARKMVATFKLCSEQLSAQDHYDYGMRAVKSVITAAGNLKRDFPDDDEEVLLLRGLMDVNTPKFLAHDLPLFEGIISDLFPGVKKPDADYEDLIGALAVACGDLKVQPVPAFIDKVIQLYEMTVVRHGLMLVGPTGGGKTMCYRALRAAQTALAAAGSQTYHKTKCVCLNPKSITMGQLYGDFDEATHEWTDGVLACYMRDLSEEPGPDKKWMMFDGPVDAIWIENMNTVLDDNKKLCLVSGEIIQMSATMTMMFEVEDLAVASPATVSRCGMIYMEPTSMGVEPLLTSFLQTLPETFEPFKEEFTKIFMSVVPGLDGVLFFIRKQLKETVTTVDNCLVAGAFNVMSSLLKRYERDEALGQAPLDETEIKDAQRAALPLWVFSLIWGLGASVTGPGRPRLETFFREKAEAHAFAKHMPPASTSGGSDCAIFEFCYDQAECRWVEWMHTVDEYAVNPEAAFAEIIVPTADTVRYTYIIDALLRNDKHVLCVGETGTGKTLNVMDKLSNHMPDAFVSVFMTFSARTSANQTQDFLDGKMEKRRKGVFGPPSGKKYAVLIDDLNMPMREKYFAQPPIELLRQWMDHKGWYDRAPPCAFKTVVDVILVGCMGPPGGGRNPVSNRALRHFNFLSFTDMSDKSLVRIFDSILGATLVKKFQPEIAALSATFVEATVEVYNVVRRDLLPTPAKSHYTFNLRDLARVFQGLLRADPKLVQADTNELYGLWMHENLRVFQDRMVNAEDRDWFRALVDRVAREKLSVSWDDVVNAPPPATDAEKGDDDDAETSASNEGTRGRLIYGDYLVPGADQPVYQRVRDANELRKVVEEALEDYNSVTSAPMNLVMFLDAIEHVSRVCRVISLPLGNALLLGVGGSGRQSLTRLAAALEEFELFQIEVAKGYGKNEWRDDLRKVLMTAGCEGKDVVFLFADTQIVQENFLEDINNILNSGEVPNLLKSEDTEAIGAALRPIMQGLGLPTTKNAVNAYFITRVRSKLHCVLAMSPVSDSFRQRLRMFPSLVNCCTIDWFSEWPLEALDSVANTFLADVAKSFEDPKALGAVVESCVFIHQSVERKSRAFLEQLRRYNYVTPTSYLELLRTFIRLLGEKRAEIELQRGRLQIGLDKLESTAKQVGVMEKELVALQPVLAKTSTEVEEMIAVITADTAVADETKTKVLAQEKAANEKAAEAKAIADDAQADLDKALPALDAAVQALKLLTKNDIVEVKALKNPPAGVRLVMEVACIFFGRKPKMVPDTREGAKPGAKMQDYWGQSTDLVKDPVKFLESLMSYDKDAISAEIIEKADPYMLREDFDPAAIKKVSKACTSICMWARAMHTYYNVSLAIEPKRAALKEAQASLEVTMGELADAKATLAGVEANLAELNDKFEAGKAKQDELKAEVSRCQAQLDRAGKLIGGLGGERTRWEKTVEALGEKLVNVVGDVVVSSGVVAYNGPFTPSFRTELLQEWSAKMAELRLPHTPGADIQTTLADPVQIRAWTIAGLPSDSVSVENGIIVAKARRWPLMIDPQGQANKWVKNMNKEYRDAKSGETLGGVDVIKLTEKDYLRTLANGIRFGRAVLLENVGETLDAALEPLLQKQTFKQGGTEVIKMGDDVIPYHPDFRFYITTKMRNPHYQPEVSVKVSLLNFFVTQDGLEDQLLGAVVMQEREDLAEAKNALVVSNARMKKQLTEIEDKILHLLSNASGNILDDEVLIDTLAQSKVTSNEITEKVAEAEATEKDIDATREKYRPVATRASVLFFCISDLALVDPMYQYSLTWFISLFVRATEDAEKDDDVDARIEILNAFFTYSLYANICRSLFERHKLMFSLLLCVAIAKQKGEIDAREWRFLLAGPTDTEIAEPNPASAWITEKVWIEIVNCSRLPAFAGFEKAFAANVEHYRSYFESADAHKHPLDDEFEPKLNSFQKLLVTRCVRPDRFMLGVSEFVAERLGRRFIEPPPFDLAACYAESSVTSPLVFVLSSGADPMADLLKFAGEVKMSKRFDQVSLGQGQGPKAESLIKQAMEEGMWVCLQNCHLAESWMPKLDVLVETIDADAVHRDFRLWLTAMPSPAFPVAILQNGVKMTLEPPKGLKSNLVRSYARLADEYIDDCKDPVAHRKLLFSICLFHAVIQDRRKFGPLGWNIRYDFTDGDLSMCQRQIKMIIDEYDVIPFKVIRVLCGEINYGGRVTDDKDRRLINNLLENYVGAEVLRDDYSWSPSGAYVMPAARNRDETVVHIRGLPPVPHPEIFGLHENADITCDQNETYAMFDTVLSLQPRVGGGAGAASREEVIEAAAKDIFDKVPEPFDIDQVGHKYPTDYGQSMNTVLTQECIRYNALLVVIRRTLREGLKALKGLVVMSPELEQVTDAIFDNRVPEMWASKAYPSLKPLSSWVLDLLERLEFIDTWIANGPPPVYWISGLFFPQAFLTGTLQNFARKNQFAIDQVSWNFNVRDTMTFANTKEAPVDGCYITGFFLEGARWDYERHELTESRPKELYTDFPLFWLEPAKDREDPTEGVYLCPAYKTLTRAGTLSTTGHSTNFVMYLEVPTDKPESHWINSSVALFTALMF
jgi:dynein heavy chain